MSSSESLHFKLGLDGAEEVGSMAALSTARSKTVTRTEQSVHHTQMKWIAIGARNTLHYSIVFSIKASFLIFFFFVVSVIVAKLQTRLCLVCLHTQG